MDSDAYDLLRKSGKCSDEYYLATTRSAIARFDAHSIDECYQLGLKYRNSLIDLLAHLKQQAPSATVSHFVAETVRYQEILDVTMQTFEQRRKKNEDASTSSLSQIGEQT